MKNKILFGVLDHALSIKRPHDAKQTIKFSHWLANNLPDHLAGEFDDIGNLHVDARSSESDRTLFVAHVDTVHKKSGKNRADKSGLALVSIQKSPAADGGFFIGAFQTNRFQFKHCSSSIAVYAEVFLETIL